MIIERTLAKDTTGLLDAFNAVAVQAASNPVVIVAIVKASVDAKKRQFEEDEGDKTEIGHNMIPLAARETAISVVDVIEREIRSFKRHKNNFVERYQHTFRGGVLSAIVLLNDWMVEKTKNQIQENQVDQVAGLMNSHCKVTLTLNYNNEGLLSRRKENYEFKQALNTVIPAPSFS